MLAVVADLAARFSAAVIGVAARQATTHGVVRGAGPREPRQHDLDKFVDQTAAAEAEFRAALPKVEVLHWRSQVTLGPAYEYVASEARSADLVVAALDPNEWALSPSGQVEAGDLLMRLGRPALLVPQNSSGLKLARALVCWNDKREARRAVTDALPLLQTTGRVDLVEIVDARAMADARRRLGDVGDWLSRHGVQSQCSVRISSGPEASQLAAISEELNADLIVAGAFGHSRLREWAFGGVTRDLLLQADRCVLASY